METIDTRLLTITAADLRPATPEEQARFGFAPCAAANLGLPAWWGELELWVGQHQDLEIPLLVNERVAPQMMSEHRVVDLEGTLISVPGLLQVGERTSRYFPTWFQVESVAPSEMNHVWVEHLVMVHGGLRNGLVPVRFGISPAPLWVRATALPPPPGTPASMRAKLMVNRFIRSGLELRSLFLFGYLAPLGEELPDPTAPKAKRAPKRKAAKKAPTSSAQESVPAGDEVPAVDAPGETPPADEAPDVDPPDEPADEA